MMEIISDYFINLSLIPGGIQINLGYAMVVILLWLFCLVFKRLRKG